MASLNIAIQKNRVKQNGQIPVTIRLTHKRQSIYLKTPYTVTKKQISKDFKLKDAFIHQQLLDKIEAYYDIINKDIGYKLNNYSIKELADYLEKFSEVKTIDFVSFSKSHIQKIKEKQPSRARRLLTSLNSLIDYYKRETIFTSELSAKVLNEFVLYLQSEHEIKRTIRGKEVTLKKVLTTGVNDYLGDIRSLFNECKKHYNDEEKGLIQVKNDPFLRFEFPKKKETEKQSLSPKLIKQIFNLPDIKINGHSGGSERANLSRDVWIISFLLIGANTADLFFMDNKKDARITYNRRKTSGRRIDKALISVKIEPELTTYIKKYKDNERVFSFHRLYSDFRTFNAAVNKGLKYVSENLGIEKISSYSARHSWATIARNECGISKDDIHLALNHVDEEKKVTDLYIKKDWSLLDKANRKVIDYLKTVS